MQISGLGFNAMQAYQTMKAAQQNPSQTQQANQTAGKSAQLAGSMDSDRDGDIDGKGKDIDVRV